MIRFLIALFFGFVQLGLAQNNLFYNAGAQVTVQAGCILYVQGGVTNATSGSNQGFIDNSGDIYLQNDWINNAANTALSPNTGTVHLFGANQFIDGTSVTTFNNLTLTGTGTKTLNINTIIGGINGVLSLNDRPFDLNRHTATITNPLPSAITRTSGYIISETNSTQGYGMVYWRCANNTGNYVVPFGTFNAEYIPVSLNIGTAGNNTGNSNSGIMATTYPTDVTLAVNNRPLPIGVNNFLNNCQTEHDKRANDRFWHLADSGYVTPPTANITFTYRDDEWNVNNGSLNTINEPDLKIWNYVNGNWQTVGGNTNIGSNTSVGSSLNQFVPYVLAEYKQLNAQLVDTTWVRCYGEANGEAFVTAFNGYGNYTYSWSNGYTLDSALTNVPAGNYSVQIKDEQNCDTTLINIFIDQPQVLTVSVTSQDTICYGANTTLTANANGGNGNYTYTWNSVDFDNSYSTTLTQTSDIVLSTFDAKGCQKDTTIRVNVRPPLTVTAFPDIGICYGKSATIGANAINNYGNVSYTWSSNQFGNPITVNPTDTTSFVVVGTDNCGVSPFSIDTIRVNVYALPQVLFSNTSVCAGNAVQFNSLSTVQSGSISQYAYDFDNDGTWDSFQPNASFTYPSGGNYIVNHLAISSLGCRDSGSKTIYVNYVPVADFSPQNVCVYDQVSLQSSSTVQGNHSIVAYSWQTGDGGILQNNNQNYLYALCGNYNITLAVITDSGCAASVTKPITIHCKPNADLTVQNGCSYTPVLFDGSASTVSNGTITGYAWDLNYLNNVNAQNGGSTNSQYYVAGTHTAALVVTSNHNCRDTVLQTFNVYPIPQAAFSYSNDCVNKQICFTNTSTVSGGSIITYNWDLNNDAVFETTSQNPCTTYVNYGVVPINLIVVSDQNCVDTIQQNLTVYPEPVADFTADNVCVGNITSFSNNSSIASGTISSYSWNFGNGQSSAQQTPNYLYNTDNIYNVCLTANSNFNCSKTNCKNVFVYPLPTASFAAPEVNGCEPLQVDFLNLSTITANNPNMSVQNVQYSWSFGDGSTAINSNGNSSNTYSAGTYTVYLQVTSSHGCVDDTVIYNYIQSFPMPEANFDYTPKDATVLSSIIDFIDKSKKADSIYYQPFENSELKGLLAGNPYTFQYPDSGTYSVMQIATTQYGCIDTIIKKIYIGPEWVFYVPNAFSPNGDGVNDLFFGKGIGIDMSTYSMMIFDRWGNLVYSESGAVKGWNGKDPMNSGPAPQDVYVYKINFMDIIKRRNHEYQGTFTLIR